MAAVAAASGAREALSYPEPLSLEEEASTPVRKSSHSPSASSSGRSPRCEAFVMTGDKILNLDHHVSPSYAKVAKELLPPNTQIQEIQRHAITVSEFPSVRRSMRSRLPVSVSQPEAVQMRRQISCPQQPLSAGPEDVPEPTVIGDHPTDPSSEPMISPVEEEKEGEGAEQDENAHQIPPAMESSMHSSYYKSAFSNPQLSTKQRTISSETFVISACESPSKQSTVTVHATTCSPSVSNPPATSPSLRRILGIQARNDSRSSFRSETEGGSKEEVEATRLATQLFKLDGYTRADVSNRINDTSEFSALVTSKYLTFFNFAGLRIDAALRDFLNRAELKGETSQRERLLRFFSQRYHDSNPNLFSGMDEVHTLTCALLLLNSDLHGPNFGKKMVVRDFINNISNTGVEIKRDLLKTLYSSIKDKAIVFQSEPTTETKPVKRPFSSRQLINEVDPESQVEYKSGWILRKSVYDSDGAKTPYGRRGWRMWFARLKGLVLYLERDEGEKKHSRYETFSNAILLHHALAQPAVDYKKKQFVFRIRTANLGEFLFQTSSYADVEDWVNKINFVCASFSTKSLPPPTGSQVTFVRPRHPKVASTASITEQLKNHEIAAADMRRQLALVQQEAPPLKARGRAVEDFFFKERYLTQEVQRYDTYCSLLRESLRGSLPASAMQSKSVINEDQDRMSYREAVNH